MTELSSKSKIRLTIASCLAFVAVVLVLFLNNVLTADVLSDGELRENGVILLSAPRDIRDIELVTHEGEDFTQESLKGGWSYVFFGFTMCPDICPRTMGIMGRMDEVLRDGTRRRLADKFRGVFVTVDPERDNEERLSRYVTGFSRYFVGLRESKEKVAAFAGQVNAAFGKVPTTSGYMVDHTSNIAVINPDGKLHAFIKPERTPEQLLRVLESFEAST